MKRISTYHFLRSLLLVAAIGAGLASCSKQDAELAPDKGDGQIRLTSRIASSPVGGTRAPIADGEVKVVLDNIRLLRKDSTAMPKDFTNLTAISASRDRAGKITFATTQLYDRLTNRNAYFFAFWPNSNTAMSGTTVTWTIGGKQDILIAGPWDAGNYTTSRSSGMVFEHPLARLEVVCRVASESEAANIRAMWGTITKIEIAQTYQYLTYDLKTQQVKHWEDKKATLPLWGADYSATFAPIAIPDAVSTDVVAAGMFAPQKGSILLRVTTEKMGVVTREVLLRKGGEHVDFESGKRHRVTLEFDKNQLVVSPYADITDWETAYETDGEIELPSELFGKPSEGILDMRYPGLVKTDGPSTITQFLMTMTRKSYNPYTYNANNADNNGGYVDSHETAYAEPAYYKLEVAKADETLVSSPTWQNAWAACKAKAPVGAWRLPRGTELALMKVNRTELEKTPGFTQFVDGDSYWSGKERTTTTAWQMVIPTMPLQSSDKANVTIATRHVRCVRELDPPLPVVENYYYSDKTFSRELRPTKTLEGVVFWVDPANPKHFKIVAMDAPPANWEGSGNVAGKLPWSTESVTSSATSKPNGKANTLTLMKLTNAAAYPAAKWCYTRNEGLTVPSTGITTTSADYKWYLPAKDELQYLFCACSGIAPMTWINSHTTPAASGYPAAWNERFATTPFMTGYYWSSSEINATTSWYVAYGAGFSTSAQRTTHSPVRCIREITL